MNGVAEYSATQLLSQDEMVERHAPLVKRIAYHLISRLPPSVQPHDLIQAGMVGLLEATRNYDATQGASFETYAGIRIRGAMLDEVRRSDWAPRSIHRKARELSSAIQRVEARTGRKAGDTDTAREMGISLDEYHKILRDVSGSRVVNFEDIGMEEGSISEAVVERSGDPTAGRQQGDVKKMLAGAIGSLPERERLVLALYYDEELNLREIGETIGVSESRVCQIRSQALARLQARLGPQQSQTD